MPPASQWRPLFQEGDKVHRQLLGLARVVHLQCAGAGSQRSEVRALDALHGRGHPLA